MSSIREDQAGLRRQNLALAAWAALLALAAGGVCVVTVTLGYGMPAWWLTAGLAFVAAATERQSVRLTRNLETSVSFLPLVFTAVAFGPLAAAVVGAATYLSDFTRETNVPQPYLRWAVYTPARALTGAVAGLTAAVFQPVSTSQFVPILIATSAAAAAHLLADAALNVITLLIRGSVTPRLFVKTLGPLFALYLPLYVPLITLLVWGYREYSVLGAATFFIPALALQRVVHLYQEQREAVTDLASANVRLERANLSFATALVATLDARDRYTAGHSTAVAIYARDIAARLSLGDTEQKLAHLCGLVHDIGKIGLPPGLLEKPTPLTFHERRQMQEHASIGERILKNVDDYAEIATVVRHHHERVDGQGYPDGLKQEEIPLVSRIIAVADAYNAMTSDRPYRDAMPSDVARARLTDAAGTQFDRSVVSAFDALLAAASEAYRRGTRRDFNSQAAETVRLVAEAQGAA
jgi:putative nucleotidyltransferase with HDIG domain